MDDQRTRQKLDDLADLFLTGVVDDLDAMPDGDEVPHPNASLLEGPAPIRLAPKMAGKSAADPEHQAEAEYDLESSLEPAANDLGDLPRPPRADDGHPMLRLTEDEREADAQAAYAAVAQSLEGPKPQQPTPQSEAPGKAVVEAVVLGNLPGLSGPWLVQYAQLIAQSDGPVAVLHVADDAIDVELVEPRPEAQPAPSRSTSTLRIPPMRSGRTGLLGLLDALVHAASGPVQTVLVRLEPTTDPRDLSRLAAIQDWTLLLGSDESAIASGRHMIHQLTQADPRLAGRHVGVMVMGSDEATATRAAEKLAEQAEDLLAEPIEFIGHLQRMQPVQVRQLGSFADPVSLWPQLVTWFNSLELPEPQAQQAVSTAKAPPPAGDVHAPGEPDTTSTAQQPNRATQTTTPEPRSTPTPRPGPFHVPKAPTPNFLRRQPPASQTSHAPQTAPRTPPAEGASAPGEQTASRTPQPGPRAKPQAAATPPRQQPQPEPQARSQSKTQSEPQPQAQPAAPAPRNLKPAPQLDLASLLADTPAALSGPMLLDARIPNQPGTQLVVDDAGIIHILLRHSSAAEAAASSDPRKAILDLIEARKWVAEHLELIALTQRDHEFVTAEPTLHLMTDRADLAMGLVSRLGQSLRLHLLQEVKLGRESGWFCTPLN